ncbi:uncharacterized protein L3040_000550 [Drepanopeziza brunnea f. sp. 'multigermtubi']|nr:hypothetical protein L3040_000550 [Drepanopeziza brunnea f. sp. 'multigermtubi']
MAANISNGYKVVRIREERFDGGRGVDFLGSSTAPFYLVNAGQNLFYGEGTVNSGGDGCDPSGVDGKKRPRASTNRKSIRGLEDPGLPPGEDSPPRQTPKQGPDTDLDSNLSSISSSQFTEDDLASDLEGPGDNREEETVTPSKREQNSIRPAPPNIIDNSIIKPIQIPKPIKIHIDFSRNSSFNPSTRSRQDVCVNVFVNGEFVYSKLFRAQSLRGSRENAYPKIAIGGRRVSKTLEVPWIVLPIRAESPTAGVVGQEETGDTLQPSVNVAQGKPVELNVPALESYNGDLIAEYKRCSPAATTFAIPKPISEEASPIPPSQSISSAESRWDEINQNLLTEAEKWGRDGEFDVFRDPVGEYLVELSKLKFPKNAKLADANSRNIGVMDVVISLGRSQAFTEHQSILEPQRNLTEAHWGNQLFRAPNESSFRGSSAPSAASTANSSTENHHRNTTGGSNSRAAGAEAAQTETQEGLSMSSMPPPASAVSAISLIAQRGHMMSTDPQIGHHPKTSRNVPQKTYRGLKSSQEEESEWPSRSTRSRVSMGSPPAPQSSQGTTDSILKTSRQTTRPQRSAASGSRTASLSKDGSSDKVDEWRRQPARFSGYLYTIIRNFVPSEPKKWTRESTDRNGYDGIGGDGKTPMRKRRSSDVPDDAPEAKVARLDTEFMKVNAPNNSESPMALEIGTASSGMQRSEVDLISPTIDEPERQPSEETPKRKRSQVSVSNRELSSLLSPHKASKIVDGSFGETFDKSFRRPTRNAAANLKQRRVTAKVEGQMLIAKGLRQDEISTCSPNTPTEHSSTEKRVKEDSFGIELKSHPNFVGSVPPHSQGSFSKTLETLPSDPESERTRPVGHEENYHSTQGFAASRQLKRPSMDLRQGQASKSKTNLAKGSKPRQPELEARKSPEFHPFIAQSLLEKPKNTAIASSYVSKAILPAKSGKVSAGSRAKAFPGTTGSRALTQSQAGPNTNDSLRCTESQDTSQTEATASPRELLDPARSPIMNKQASETRTIEVLDAKAERAAASIGWRPTVLCQDSVLSYVGDEKTAKLLGIDFKKKEGNFCRKTGADRMKVFRACTILMGVRYVFGLESTAEKK